MKKLILAAILAATTASADAAVTYTFAGTADDGNVSGSVTIDTDLLTANGDVDPAIFYYFATDDAGSNVGGSFLSIQLSSTGGNPALLGDGATYQSLAVDADGNLSLELDFQRILDGIVTSSRFTLWSDGAVPTHNVSGALLPDFEHGGSFGYFAQSGAGEEETYDTFSSGAISFAAAAPAPEAATWAMMVLGFGAVGYAARRRARVAFA